MLKRLSINTIISSLLFLVFAGIFYYTYFERLRPVELLIPRISLGLLLVGSLLVIIGDFRKPMMVRRLNRDWTILPIVAGVSLIMYLYGQAFIYIGLATTTFVFLMGWWLYVAIRDSREEPSSLLPRITKYFLLAVVLSGVVYLFFIVLLRIYLPRPLLF